MNRFLSRCENFTFGSIIASLVTAIELSTTWHRTESTKRRKNTSKSSETRFKSTTQENHGKRLRIPGQQNDPTTRPPQGRNESASEFTAWWEPRVVSMASRCGLECHTALPINFGRASSSEYSQMNFNNQN